MIEILVEFVQADLKLIWIQLQICFSEGLIQSNNDPFFAVSSQPALKLLRCCCAAAAQWRRGGAAATADVGCCGAQQSGKDLMGWMDDVGRHRRRDLPGLLLSNERNFRSLQV